MIMKQKKIISIEICCIILILVVTWFFINNSSQISKEKFGIYLFENNELVVSDKDILSYNKTSHIIKLTEDGANKINNLFVGVYGKPFVMILNGKEMYNGSFWTSISSVSYSGVVILIDDVSINNSIAIQLGYPSLGFYDGKYLINNSEIFYYFERLGKLIK